MHIITNKKSYLFIAPLTWAFFYPLNKNNKTTIAMSYIHSCIGYILYQNTKKMHERDLHDKFFVFYLLH